MDIAKAFDTLSWDFLFSCLNGMNVPEKNFHWLRSCICTTSFMVGYNGTVNGYFKGTRGLRQGDPLSPYLFVIAMNCLSHMLNNVATRPGFKYHSNCKKIKLTHLSFADDLLIFIEDNIESVQCVLQVLKEFEERSGLAVSMQKTSFFASGVSEEEINTIQASTGMACGSLPFRYLGVPMNSRKLSLASCEPLLHQIKTRFNSWSTKTLSFSGRLMLIKTVISGITTFWCSSFVLPKACIAKINSMCSVFLWKGNLESHNTARVAWSTIVKPKDEGGLGVKDLLTWNKACCLRLIWMLFFRPDSVWVSWYKEVILKGSVSNFWTTNPSQNFSWMANKLLKMRNVAYPLIHLGVQNGECGRFWIDNWSPFGSLQEYLEGGRTRLGIPKNATLASLHRNGSWRLPAARTEHQLQVLTFITTIQFNEESDYYEWEINGKLSEKYCTGEVYRYLRGDGEKVDWSAAIWTSRSIPRQSFHAWLVVQNRIPTRDRMIGWGIQVPPLCLLCNANDESRDHLYWDCNYTFDLWSIVAGRCRITPERRWENTLHQMITLPPPSSTRSLILLGWQATLYWIWNERNGRLHSNQFRSIDSLFSIIDHQVRNKIQSFREANPRRSSEMMQLWFR